MTDDAQPESRPLAPSRRTVLKAVAGGAVGAALPIPAVSAPVVAEAAVAASAAAPALSLTGGMETAQAFLKLTQGAKTLHSFASAIDAVMSSVKGAKTPPEATEDPATYRIETLFFTGGGWSRYQWLLSEVAEHPEYASMTLQDLRRYDAAWNMIQIQSSDHSSEEPFDLEYSRRKFHEMLDELTAGLGERAKSMTLVDAVRESLREHTIDMWKYISENPRQAVRFIADVDAQEREGMLGALGEFVDPVEFAPLHERVLRNVELVKRFEQAAPSRLAATRDLLPLRQQYPGVPLDELITDDLKIIEQPAENVALNAPTDTKTPLTRVSPRAAAKLIEAAPSTTQQLRQEFPCLRIDSDGFDAEGNPRFLIDMNDRKLTVNDSIDALGDILNTIFEPAEPGQFPTKGEPRYEQLPSLQRGLIVVHADDKALRKQIGTFQAVQGAQIER